MKKISKLAAMALICGLVAAACAPATTIQPEQIVVDMPFPDAFAIVARTISTQPYPSDKGGWVVVNSDQVGGLILAEMHYTSYNLFIGFTSHVERVSVAFNSIGDDKTGVIVSLSGGEEAQKLADAIVRDLTN